MRIVIEIPDDKLPVPFTDPPDGSLPGIGKENVWGFLNERIVSGSLEKYTRILAGASQRWEHLIQNAQWDIILANLIMSGMRIE